MLINSSPGINILQEVCLIGEVTFEKTVLWALHMVGILLS